MPTTHQYTFDGHIETKFIGQNFTQPCPHEMGKWLKCNNTCNTVAVLTEFFLKVITLWPCREQNEIINIAKCFSPGGWKKNLLSMERTRLSWWVFETFFLLKIFLVTEPCGDLGYRIQEINHDIFVCLYICISTVTIIKI